MNYKMQLVTSAREIEKAVELQYGVRIELAPLMWPADYQNDCYKLLAFDNDIIEENKGDIEKYGDTEFVHKELVYSILQDTFPTFNKILVDVSW